MWIGVDHREEGKRIWYGKQLFPDLKVCQFDIADVIVENKGKTLAIEIKTMKDLRDSTFDGRLTEQPIKMLEKFDYRAVFIIGGYQEYITETDDTTLTEEMYNGKIASLGLKYQVMPVTVDDEKHLWRMIRSWAYRLEIAGDPVQKPVVLPPKTDDIHARMLAVIPNLGVDKAMAILDKFYFWDLPLVEEKELLEIKGIGKVFAKRIKEICKYNLGDE